MSTPNNTDQSLYNSVIVFGATGNCGLETAKSLLENYPQVKLTLFVRSEEKVASLKEKGASVIVGDILQTSEEEFVKILSGQDVVITALTSTPELLLGGQLKLIEASKKAGVKKFVPTTYGIDFTRFKPEEILLNHAKFEIANHLKQSGLEFVQVHVGLFAHLASYFLFNNFDQETNTVHYNGDLNEKIDISFLEDIGKFVAQAAVRRDIVGDVEVHSDTLTLKEISQIVHGEGVKYHQDFTADAWFKSIGERIAEKSNSPQEMFPILLEQLKWSLISGKARPAEENAQTTELFSNIQRRSFKTMSKQQQ